jgi:Secretion system C-terminal sorting domain
LDVIFSINTDGTGFRILHQSDGIDAGRYGASLILNDSYLYCATKQGGPFDTGTLFRIKTDGTGLQKLVDFDYPIGAYPQDPIIISNSRIYGATKVGGPIGSGSIFEVKTDGTGFRNIVDFWSLFGHSEKKSASAKSLNLINAMDSKGPAESTTEGSISISENSLFISATETSAGLKESKIFKYDFVTTAIKDYLETDMDIKMYPNPAKNFISVEYESETTEHLEIFNSSGIKVIDTEISSGQQLNISKLPSGIYTLHIQSRYLKLLKL